MTETMKTLVTSLSTPIHLRYYNKMKEKCDRYCQPQRRIVVRYILIRDRHGDEDPCCDWLCEDAKISSRRRKGMTQKVSRQIVQSKLRPPDTRWIIVSRLHALLAAPRDILSCALLTVLSVALNKQQSVDLWWAVAVISPRWVSLLKGTSCKGNSIVLSIFFH